MSDIDLRIAHGFQQTLKLDCHRGGFPSKAFSVRYCPGTAKIYETKKACSKCLYAHSTQFVGQLPAQGSPLGRLLLPGGRPQV